MVQALVILAIVLTLVTLVGHGIWVLVAAIIRALSGGPAAALKKRCLHCGQLTADDARRCDWCGRDTTGQTAEELADVEAFVRQVKRLQRAGSINDAAAVGLLARAETYRKGLLEPPAPQPAAAPVATPSRPAAVQPPGGQKRPGEIAVAEVVEEPKPAAPRPTARPEPPRPVSLPKREPPARPRELRPEPRPQPEPVAAPAPPRRSWGEMLEAFMEERNMRWGELIGGLLFVGGGIALAVSLRDKLQAIPYSQFLIFAAIAVLVYFLGLYSHYRWKLANTSRGLLVIGMLLAPLSFLIMADLSKEGGQALAMVVELSALAIFGCLSWFAARVIVPEGPRLAVLAVLGNSAAVLLASRFVGEQTPGPWAVAAGCVPVAVFAGAVGGYLVRMTEPRKLDAARVVGLLTMLGLAAFATILVLGHLLARGAQAESVGLPLMLDRMSLAVALAAVPIFAAGLSIMRGTIRHAALEGWRVTGTTIALVGVVVMLAGLVLAWPQPLAIMAIGSVEAVVLAVAAFRYRLPIAHAGVIVAAALVSMVGYHAVVTNPLLLWLPREELGPEMLRLTTLAPSGNVLGVLFLVSAAVAEWLVCRGYRRHGLVYAVGCGALAAAGLSLVTWHGTAGGPDALRAAILYGVYGLVSLGFAARWNRKRLSYLGLGLVQGSLLWAMWWGERPLHLALLLLASAAAVAAEGFAATLGRSARTMRVHLRRVFIEPLGHAALLSSGAALVWLLIAPSAETAILARDLFWLSGIWLLLAWTTRLDWLMGAAQAVLAAAVAAATTAWLENQSWPWLDPQTVQAYGITLAGLGLAWLAVRMALAGNRRVRRLLNPPWPAVDQVVQYLVVAAQFVAVVAVMAPNVYDELVPSGAAVTGHKATMMLTVGPGAWLLLGLLAAAMVASLWHRWTIAELVSSLVLALTAACLVAGRFAPDLATASALRWTLGGVFLLGSVAVWNRRWLQRAALGYQARLDLAPGASLVARSVLVGAAVVPVVGLTIFAALLQISGAAPAGPAAMSLFDQMGSTWSYLVPLVLVIAGLVGYALRDNSAAHAFAAGLVVELAVVLGYALRVSAWSGQEFVEMVQLATIAAAVWAGAWLVTRRWTETWREGPQRPVARVLMTLQLAMGVAGNFVLLLPALAVLALIAPYYDDWAVYAGGPLGWAALVSVAAGIVYRRVSEGKRLPADVVGLAGMTAIGLLACTVQGIQGIEPEWGFRSLMLGWAIYSVVVAMATWWVATLYTEPDAAGPPQVLVRAAAVWVRVAGILAVLLGFKAAFFYEEQLWGATAIALAGVAGATMAVWRRREGWAFSAALGVNLAASLAVWHYHYTDDLLKWWTLLVQANVIASSAVALVWLAAVRRLYELRDTAPTTGPLLALQTALPVVGQAILCLLPVGCLLWSPERLPAHWPSELAAPQGWFALALVAAAAGWFSLRTSLADLVHLVAGFALAVVALLACTAAVAGTEWLSYHVLTLGFAAVGLGVLALGMTGEGIGRNLFPARDVEGWVSFIAAAVAVLAVLHSGHDPENPWWSGGALVAVSLMTGLLALWRRLPSYVFLSGLTLNVIGTIAWYYWATRSPGSLLDTNVLCLAIGSTVWSLIALPWPHAVPAWQSSRRRLPFAHVAAQAAVFLSVLTVVARVWFSVVEIDHPAADSLAWAALGATGLSILVLLWDRTARLAVPGLYLVAVLAIGLGLDSRELTSRPLCWTAMIDLAALALVAAALGWSLPRLKGVWHALRIHDDRVHWPNWFSMAQQATVAVAAALAVWVSLDVAFDAVTYPGLAMTFGRMASPAVAVLLAMAAVVMVAQTHKTFRADWQLTTLLLGLVVAACLGWTLLPPSTPAPWLHRGVILMAAAAAMAWLSGAGVPRVFSGESGWATAGRRVMPGLAGLALASLVLVLLGEGIIYANNHGDVPMALWAEVTVAVALGALATGAILLAVVPGWDPFKLSLRGRTAYVYAAEVLVGVFCLHLRLTFPELFDSGIIRRYWMLIVMAIAFGGAGLSEWFHRRRVPVLSDPLAKTALVLPLAPAVGFWFMTAETATPAMWFLMGLFYGMLSVMRRSPWMAALAIATGNMGLWVFWSRLEGYSFVDHPQLWLIPAALCALVAEYLHHDRLEPGQSAALRYLALGTIYLSSTTEFMRDIGENNWIWLPLALVGLSLLGALAGILLRIRSFLYLGVLFLMVVLVRMIIYAAFEQGQMWTFFAAVLCAGAAIIALFAVFEKRRNDVLAAVARLKDWQQ